MAPDEKQEAAKSLEMRIAAIEDKLAKMAITEEELKAYQKVSALLGGQGAQGSIAAGCVVDCSGGCINECSIGRGGILPRMRSILPRFIPRNIPECFECGPATGGGGGLTGGFGSLGG